MRAVLSLALVVALSGCFQMASVLTVRPDGSATLRDEVTLSGMALLAFSETTDEGGESGALFDRSVAEARAEALGEGVRLASFEMGEAGYVAVYEVPDVRVLRYSTPDLPTGNDAEGPADSPVTDGVDLSFAFDAGAPATLRVIVPKPTPEKPKAAARGAGDAEVDPAEQAQMLQMMRSFFADARMRVEVEVEGEVVETNAAYAEESTATLFDLPFDAVFDVIEADPEVLEGGPSDPAVLLEKLKAIEGVRIEEPGTVRIRFR